MAVYLYNYQYNLYMYDLCMFNRYLVSITQVRKDTWYDCENYLLLLLFYLCLVWCPGQNKRIAPLSFHHGCRKRRLKD
jgi:hypothetical protein